MLRYNRRQPWSSKIIGTRYPSSNPSPLQRHKEEKNPSEAELPIANTNIHLHTVEHSFLFRKRSMALLNPNNMQTDNLEQAPATMDCT